jgi:hypothetical protein
MPTEASSCHLILIYTMAVTQGKVRADHVKQALGVEKAPLTWLAIKVSLVYR